MTIYSIDKNDIYVESYYLNDFELDEILKFRSNSVCAKNTKILCHTFYEDTRNEIMIKNERSINNKNVINLNSSYYTVGITGHRDLLDKEKSYYKEQIKSYLKNLSNTINKPILLVSPIADGADRLFIEAGCELNLDYVVVLPMPIQYYTKDFSEESLVEFNSLLIHANKYSSLDVIDGKTEEDIAYYGPARDQQYFAIGKFLADNCDALVVLWDGEYNQKTGGTADVVKYRMNLGKDFFHIQCKRKEEV